MQWLDENPQFPIHNRSIAAVLIFSVAEPV